MIDLLKSLLQCFDVEAGFFILLVHAQQFCFTVLLIFHDSKTFFILTPS